MKNSIKYRPEIDGLRGIAIVLVVIYHARFYSDHDFIISGGFLGVDIFFVISGYLMMSILLKEISINEKFSFKVFLNFFESRLRRIWPAYFFLIFVCIILFNYAFLGDTLHNFMKDSFFASIFHSNHWFSKKLTEYAAETSLNLPLLHTWSLSVEIKFYLFFPIIIFLCFSYFRKKYFIVLFILSLASIAYAQFIQLGWENERKSFFLFSTRFFELLIGSMVYLIERNNAYQLMLNNLQKNKNSFVKPDILGSFFGIILIIYSIFFLNNENIYPSIYTLLPIIGTASLILFARENFIEKILSNKIIVGIGVISYSLYLWHFPIFSFPRSLYLINEANNYSKILLIILSLILAIFSYYIIEKPFRNKKIISFRNLFLLSSISIIFLASSTLYLVKTKKTFRNYPDFISENVNKISWKDVRDGLGYCYARSKIYCRWNWEYDQIPRIYMVGDSHMSVLEKDIVDYAISKDIGIKLITGRFYLPDFKVYKKDNNQEIKSYVAKIEKAENILTKKTEENIPAGGNIVIYGAYFSSYLKDNEYVQEGTERISKTFYQPIDIKNPILDKKIREKYILDGIEKSLKNILDKNYLILVYPIPEAGILVGRKFMTLSLKDTSLINGIPFTKWIKNNPYYITTPYNIYLERNKKLIDLFNKINHPNLYRVYPEKIFCNNQVENKCITHNNKTIFYHDRSHLSPDGAKLVNKEIINILENIYEKYPGDYSEVMKTFQTGVGVKPGESLKGYIKRNDIIIKNNVVK